MLQRGNEISSATYTAADKSMETVLQIILIFLSVHSLSSAKRRNFRLVTFCSRSPSNCERKV